MKKAWTFFRYDVLFQQSRIFEISTMVITVGSDLETALNDQARKQGIAPEALAVQALRARFLPATLRHQPVDDWERRLRSAATDCGVSLSNEAVSSDGLYD